MPIAWLSISAEDNDLDRFFRCLLMAWEEVQPGIQKGLVGLLLGWLGCSVDQKASLFGYDE